MWYHLCYSWWKGGVTIHSAPVQSDRKRAKGKSGYTEKLTSTLEPYHLPFQSLPSAHSYFLSTFPARASGPLLQNKRMDWEHKLKQALILSAATSFQGCLSPVVKIRASREPQILHPYHVSLLFSDTNRWGWCGSVGMDVIIKNSYMIICP